MLRQVRIDKKEFFEELTSFILKIGGISNISHIDNGKCQIYYYRNTKVFKILYIEAELIYYKFIEGRNNFE